MERVLCTLGHQEPDRVPLFLLFSLYGARETGLTVEEYFSDADNVVAAQIMMKEKYQNDCYYTFFYGALEVEAWGGEVTFYSQGPPNAGDPILNRPEDIDNLEVPTLEACPAIQRVLEVTRRLSLAARGETPLIGVVMAPFSLPVMQMGFEAYLQLIYFDRPRFDRLMEINRRFCLSWAAAQLEAGATAICYFNPLASADLIDRNLYLSTGYRVDAETCAGIKGPVATHLASGRVLPVLDDIIRTGSGVIGIGSSEDPGKIKQGAKGKITILGNLNGLEMAGWNQAKTVEKVSGIIRKAAPGGGFILSDSHGEIPWQVPEEVLLQISETARRVGRYPISLKG
jgi:uroporphyrinogen decarboxylase